MVRFSISYVCFILLLSVFVTSCQKDESVKNPNAGNTQMQADSAKKLNTVSAPGNYLARTGTLKLKVQDSTYIFDASKDSVAFVNIDIDGNQYFGITAINKAHTVSFGISSLGSPITDLASSVAGCQFLLNTSGKMNLEYTLTRNASPQDYGAIVIEKYIQDTILAKGTFHTYLAKDTKPNSTFFIADGSFELKTK
jgi:hypothetical protein